MKVTKHIGLDSELAKELIKESKRIDKPQIWIIEYALKAYFDLRIIIQKDLENENSRRNT